MKNYILLLIFALSSTVLFSQEVFHFRTSNTSNKVKTQKATIKKVSFNTPNTTNTTKPVSNKSDVTPRLELEMIYVADSKDSLGTFSITLINSGNGKAQAINMVVRDIINEKEVSSLQLGKVNYLNVNNEKTFQVLLDNESKKHKVTIDVKEELGWNFSQTFYVNTSYLSGKRVVDVSKDRFVFNGEYDYGLPPDLKVEMNFNDENSNGILESYESSILKLKLTNEGAGKAQGLKIVLVDNIEDEEFSIAKVYEIPFIKPNETKTIEIPIKAGFNVKTAEHKLTIDITEYFGYDMDQASLILNTLEYQKPNLVFAGYEIIDTGDRTYSKIADGLLQAGENVKLKVYIQNIGQNIAKDNYFTIHSTNKNIRFNSANINTYSDTIGDLKVGEVKEFIVYMSPNKRVKDITGELPIFLEIKTKYDFGELKQQQLPIVMNQKPPKKQTLKVDVDMSKYEQKVARFEFKGKIGKYKGIVDVKQSKTKRKNAVAVVIGIEDYKNLPNAPYADNDAEIIEKYLKNRLGVEHVITRTNKELYGLEFDNLFHPDYGELQKYVEKDSTDVFVFYSGHGVPSKDGKNIYLFPSDGKVERMDKVGYNINDLYLNLEKLGAKSTTVFIDACFSGSSRATQDSKSGSDTYKMENLIAAKGVKIKPKLETPWLRNSTFTVFNSSGPSETSLGFSPSETGLFTYYICAGLQGAADENNDNKITTGELKNYVKKNVLETSKKIFGAQTPQFHGDEDMILLEY
ncbi:MAG: caspase family protein [Flavobacteriales bacterium]|nr:caspase family protein [Flavobacteriales bacterium]